MKNKKYLLIILATLSVFGLTFANTAFGKDAVFLFTWGSAGTGDGQFGPRFTEGIAIDTEENVYVTDNENDRVQKFKSNGEFIAKWGTTGIGNGQFHSPVGIAVDGSGHVFVTDWYNNRIQKFTDEGIFIKKWGSYGTGPGQFYDPRDITIDRKGDIYVTDLLNSRVQKFSPDGEYLNQWGTNGSNDGQFQYINGIAIDSLGRIYICDHSNHRIQKFTENGTFILKWGSFGIGDGEFQFPVGIAVDKMNNIYVTDQYNHRVQKFTSEGEYLDQWGSFGTMGGQFFYPAGIDIGKLDNIYVVDAWNSRIQVFEPPEIFSPKVFLTGGGRYEIEKPVILSGEVSDIDGGFLSYSWQDNSQILFSGSVQTESGEKLAKLANFTLSNLSLGIHKIKFELSDGINEPFAKEIIVDIFDNIEPVFAPIASKKILWPPNHKMVPIKINTNVSDNSGQPVTLSASVSCNESPKKSEMFWTEPVIDEERGIITLDLLAERFGKGMERIYAVTIVGEDISGNSSSTSLNITVPHDMGKN